MWISTLRKRVDATRDTHPLWPVMHMMENGESVLGGRYPAEPSSSEVTALLKATVRRNVEYLVRVGFLGATDGSRASEQGLEKTFKGSGLD